MGYATGSSAILTLLRAMSDWDSKNSSREDWGILNTGKSNKYAILKPGEEYQNEVISLGHKTQIRTYTTVIEVWVLAKTPGKSLTTLQTLTDSIVSTLDRYPNLGLGTSNAIRGASVLGGGEMQDRWVNTRGFTWVTWDVTIEWKEERSTSSAET